MFTVALALAALSLIKSVAADASLYVYNNCGDTIWAHEYVNGFDKVNLYTIGAGSGAFLEVPGIPSSGDPNAAVNIYTGCTDNSATDCTTGGVNNQFVNSNLKPFIRGEVAYSNGYADVYYDISPLYGYNRALKINTDDASCPGMQCNINSGCPVPGPDGSCYAPCCSDAASCAGTNSCPTDSVTGEAHAGPGVNSAFYHNACPNAYSFPLDDVCARFDHSPTASCFSNNRVTMTVCPTGSSSQYQLC